LSALNILNSGSSAPEIARQADRYRAFSLFALGRMREAESIAESLIRKEPLAHLDEADVSPRIEKMFTDVRKRLLPSLIRTVPRGEIGWIAEPHRRRAAIDPGTIPD
jgi:hypothetical protein